MGREERNQCPRRAGGRGGEGGAWVLGGGCAQEGTGKAQGCPRCARSWRRSARPRCSRSRPRPRSARAADHRLQEAQAPQSLRSTWPWGPGAGVPEGLENQPANRTVTQAPPWLSPSSAESLKCAVSRPLVSMPGKWGLERLISCLWAHFRHPRPPWPHFRGGGTRAPSSLWEGVFRVSSGVGRGRAPWFVRKSHMLRGKPWTPPSPSALHRVTGSARVPAICLLLWVTVHHSRRVATGHPDSPGGAAHPGFFLFGRVILAGGQRVALSPS